MRALLVAALLAVPFAGCIGTFDPVEDAGWLPGYSFTFETSESGTQATSRYENGTKVASSDSTEEDETETLRYQVLSVDDASGAERYAVVLAHPLTGEARLRAYRLSDLAEAHVDVDDGRVQVGGGHEGPVRFPLAPDQRHEDRSDGPGEAYVTTVVVEGAERVDGPAGKVEAIRIVHEVEADVEAMTIDVQKQIADEGGRDIDVEVALDAHRVVWYAPSLHNVVRDEQRAEFSWDVSYTDADGTRRRNVFEGEYEAVSVLTQATFAVGEDLDASGILEALRIGAHPGAVIPEPGAGTTVRLTGKGGAVGLADGTELTLDVATVELRNPVAVELKGPSGVQRAQVPAAGGRLAFTVDQPGTHTWTATTTGDDERVTTVLRVAVDLRDTVSASCPVAAVESACDPLEFELPAGLRDLTVVAEREPLLLEPGLATLRVTGPEDEDTDTMLAGNEASVSLTAPAAGAYVVVLETTGPASGVAYTVSAGASSDGPGARQSIHALLGW